MFFIPPLAAAFGHEDPRRLMILPAKRSGDWTAIGGLQSGVSPALPANFGKGSLP